MASITYWQQLQPSPRDASIATSLAACVRDPAWMLSRQWQLGDQLPFDKIAGPCNTDATTAPIPARPPLRS